MNRNEALDLARMLPGCASYNIEEIVVGLMAERERLGLEPFALIRSSLWLDFDGFVDGAEILGSFATLELAVKAAREEYEKLNSTYAHERDYPPSQKTSAQAVCAQPGSAFALELTLVRKPYDRDDIFLDVFGPFREGAISSQAFEHYVGLPARRSALDPLGELLSRPFFGLGKDILRRGRGSNTALPNVEG